MLEERERHQAEELEIKDRIESKKSAKLDLKWEQERVNQEFWTCSRQLEGRTSPASLPKSAKEPTAWRRVNSKEYPAWRMPTVLSGRWWSRRVQVDKRSQV